MKKVITFFCLFLFIGLADAQQASDYFPSQTGFEWKFKQTPLDSANIPNPSLSVYRIDKFESVANYEGKLANIVQTKTGPLQTILLQPFLDSLFYATEGTNGFEYFSIRNIEPFLIALDTSGFISNFSFLDFFTSLQDWYSTYRFTSNVNTEYTLLQRDTTITIGTINAYLRFKYVAKRLQDQTIQTVLGSYNCKKFLLQWKIIYYLIPPPFPGIELFSTNDSIWIAPGNWIVQDIIPANNVDLTILGIPAFSIPGLETKLTDEIVNVVENEETIPSAFSLEQNYPNPFNPTTNIGFRIADRGFVSLKVFDILGNEVATLVNGELQAGVYEVEFNASTLLGSVSTKGGYASGVYFYKLQSGGFIETKKMLLLK